MTRTSLLIVLLLGCGTDAQRPDTASTTADPDPIARLVGGSAGTDALDTDAEALNLDATVDAGMLTTDAEVPPDATADGSNAPTDAATTLDAGPTDAGPTDAEPPPPLGGTCDLCPGMQDSECMSSYRCVQRSYDNYTYVCMPLNHPSTTCTQYPGAEYLVNSVGSYTPKVCTPYNGTPLSCDEWRALTGL